MRIIVLVKQILDPAGITIRRDKERIFINREEYILGPGSKAAIEAALRLKGAGGGTPQVVALSLGEARADDALREAMAMGCDEAYLLSDEAFKEADISMAAQIVAAAVEKLGGADLIVAGRRSGDTAAGQMAPRLAEALGYAGLTDAYTLALEAGNLQATRRWGDGYAGLKTALPAVVSVAPEAFPPRYAHGARIMDAYRQWAVTTWNAGDLGLAEEALQPRLRFRSETFPAPQEMGERFRGEADSVAQDAVTALRIQKLIGQ